MAERSTYAAFGFNAPAARAAAGDPARGAASLRSASRARGHPADPEGDARSSFVHGGASRGCGGASGRAGHVVSGGGPAAHAPRHRHPILAVARHAHPHRRMPSARVSPAAIAICRTASPRAFTIRSGCSPGNGRWASTRARTPHRRFASTTRCRERRSIPSAAIRRSIRRWSPPKRLVESELDDWWTMGRRVRVGDGSRRAPGRPDAEGVRFVDPPPPYDAFDGRLDGRAIWLARERLGVPESAFGDDAPPGGQSGALGFLPAQLPRAVRDARGRRLPLAIIMADRWTGTRPTAIRPAPWRAPRPVPRERSRRRWNIRAPRTAASGKSRTRMSTSAAIRPTRRISRPCCWSTWSTRMATTGSCFRSLTARGHIVTIRSLAVTDSFGRHLLQRARLPKRRPISWPAPAGGFLDLQVRWPRRRSLVLWPVAESPLESAPIERVQFGVGRAQQCALGARADHRRARGRARGRRSRRRHPAYPAPAPIGDRPRRRRVTSIPARRESSRAGTRTSSMGRRRRAGVRAAGPRRLLAAAPAADAASRGRGAEGRNARSPELHRIAAAAMAAGGLELERRWQLARDMRTAGAVGPAPAPRASHASGADYPIRRYGRGRAGHVNTDATLVHLTFSIARHSKRVFVERITQPSAVRARLIGFARRQFRLRCRRLPWACRTLSTEGQNVSIKRGNSSLLIGLEADIRRLVAGVRE